MTLKEEKRAKCQLRQFIVLSVSLYAPPKCRWTNLHTFLSQWTETRFEQSRFYKVLSDKVDTSLLRLANIAAMIPAYLNDDEYFSVDFLDSENCRLLLGSESQRKYFISRLIANINNQSAKRSIMSGLGLSKIGQRKTEKS